MTATAEAPAIPQTELTPKRKGGTITALTFDREAIRTASIAGLEDKDIATRFPGLKQATIRKWRERDKDWSTAYYATRKATNGGRAPSHLKPPAAIKQQTAASHSVTVSLLDQGLPEIAQRNRIRMAYEVDRALAKRAKSRKPLPIESFAELNQAGRALLLAEGRDADAPALTLNVWGNPGLQAQQDTGGFRDLPAETADPPQPDGP